MVRTFLSPETVQKRKRALSMLFLGGLAALSACAGPTRSYRPPGPAVDAWRPYIQEASTRFSIPQSWIRAIMQQESGGHQYMHGRLTRSVHGAVGLMQLKPDTYRELARRYRLGSDPYNPHDNIMAGSGYIRELYDRFGSPGFVIAYNCGPQCAENHRRHGTSLPAYARTYLAAVKPHLNDPIPTIAPTTEVAYAPAAPAAASSSDNTAANTADSDPDRDIPVTSTPAAPPPAYTAPAATTVWQQDTGGNSMIQIGAFSTQERALQAAALARQSSSSLAGAVNRIEMIPASNGRYIWRTRLAGLSITQTGPICSQLRQQGLPCVLVVKQ